MISIDDLKEKIVQSGLADKIVKTLNLSYSPENYLKNASDEEIILAFSKASALNNEIANALHKYPLPDDYKLLGKYTGDNLTYHIHGGFFAARLISTRARAHAFAFENQKDIFEFGCGTSRILRFLSEYCPGPKYYGSDVYENVVEWGKIAFPDITYIHQNYRPPLTNDLPKESFDVIYAWSIFSHFDEKLHWEWLAELHRLLRPRGLLICSVHGKVLLDRIINEKELRSQMALSEKKASELINVFNEKGFAFRTRYDCDELAKGGIDSSTFGLAYISDWYINNRWSQIYEVLSIEEGIISRYQDLITLKKA